MGLEGALMGASTAMSMIGSVSKGQAAQSDANTQAMLYDVEAVLQEKEGDIAYQDAKQAAIQRAREVRKFQAMQATKYVQSGVTLEGTPIAVLEETRKLGQQEVDYMLKRGQSLKNLAYLRAGNTRLTGEVTRAQGRSALYGGIFDAMGTGLSNAFTFARGSSFGGSPSGSPSMVYSDNITNVVEGSNYIAPR